MHRLIAALTLAVLATEASAQSTTTFYTDGFFFFALK
jgi:hypothetical protein